MRYDKIVFEGPNNVGKSTLIEAIQKHLKNYEIEHVTEKCPNDYDFYNDLLTLEEPMIFDRLHLGEMVYPYIYSRDGKLTDKEFDALLDNHREHVLIILVDADYDFIARSCEKKCEDFDYAVIREEKLRFYNLWKRLQKENVNCIRIKNHWDNVTKSIIIGKIVEEICK